MKTLAIASVVIVASCGGVAAHAQRLDERQIAAVPVSTAATYGTTYGAPGDGVQAVPPTAPPTVPAPPAIQRVPVPPSGVPAGGPPPLRSHGQHWGGSVGGHWSGGMQAPGGWHAYRRPGRGFVLPNYWFSPSFFITDFGVYGLQSPPYGYRWTRYYDDAVLVDDNGRVADSVQGIQWDDDRGDAYQGGYADNGYGSRSDSYQRHDGWGAGYPPPGAYPPPPPPPSGAPIIERWSGQQGYTRTYVAGSGYYAGGYWYPPVVTTTITVETAPSITTTTTEYIETKSYRARRVYHAPKRRIIHRRPACVCGS